MQQSSNIGYSGRWKFIAGGLLILAAVIYLIISSTKANVRISGAVAGETIQFDPTTSELSFEIANVPGDNATIAAEGGLAKVLHDAVTDPSRTRLKIIYNGPKPDLLRDEAQAIITGHLNGDGTFQADELLLKCPTKYQEAIPSQVSGS
jgi:cytochrome c-type biogenesis protein CcmE